MITQKKPVLLTFIIKADLQRKVQTERKNFQVLAHSPKAVTTRAELIGTKNQELFRVFPVSAVFEAILDI